MIYEKMHAVRKCLTAAMEKKKKFQSSVGRHKRCYGDGIRFGQLSDDPTVNDMEVSTLYSTRTLDSK